MTINEKIDGHTEKRRRGRPHKTDEEAAAAREKTRRLAQEVRAALPGKDGKRLKVEVLLGELSRFGFGGSESLWRRYEAGLDAMSPGRMFDVAAWAFAQGARGEAVRNALLPPRHSRTTMTGPSAEEELIEEMSEAIYKYIDYIHFFGDGIDDDFFSKMMSVAEDAAWQKYKRLDEECAAREMEALDKTGYWDDPDAWYAAREAAMVAELKKLEEENFRVPESPGGGIVYGVPKPIWLKKKPKL